MRYFAFILLLTFSACVSIPKSDLAEPCDPLSLNQFTTQALQEENFVAGDWPKEEWWEPFEDPQLASLIELGLSGNPTLKKALARVEDARQLAKVERARLFPYIDLQYDELWQHYSKNGFIRSYFPIPAGGMPPPATADTIDLTLNFTYEIDFWGKNKAIFRAALGEARALAAEAAQAKLIVTTSIAETYFGLQADLTLQKILQEWLDDRSQRYALNNARYERGIDSGIPVLEAEEDFYGIEQTLLWVGGEIALKQNLLNVLTGQGPDAPPPSLPLSAAYDQPFPLPADLSTDLLARRPDLQAQIWRVEAAAERIKAAKTDFYPSVNLSAFGGLESLAFRNLFKIGSRQGALEPAIHLPIFTGGKLRANLKAKAAEFNEAVYGYNELLLQAAQEVADQILLLQIQKEQWDVQIATLDASQKRNALRSALFEKGIDNYLSVLDSKAELLNQQYAWVTYRRDYLLAVLQLIKGLGGGYDLPLEGIHAR